MTRVATMLMLMFVLCTVAAAEPSESQRVYEAKCLYCHSGANADRLRLRPDQWRRLVERMRGRAPLLISRRDAQLVVQYFVNERRHVLRPLATARPGTQERPPAPVATAPKIGTDTSCCPSCCDPARAEITQWPTADPDPVAPSPPQDSEAEALGPGLLADRCSKCHTVRRAFMRITTVENGRATIERMRRKMGSGISPDDTALLVRFLRARIGRADDAE